MAEKTNINQHIQQPVIGLDLDHTEMAQGEGTLTYALNAVSENFDGNAVTYQNDQGNDLCFNPPTGYTVIGVKEMPELGKVFYWLTDGTNSQIGYAQKCDYTVLFSDEGQDSKLNFSILQPIRKIISKTTNCSIQFYWTDGLNPRRYFDLDDLPWKEIPDPTNDYKKIKLVGTLDVNKMLVQPNFSIPKILPVAVEVGGSLRMGVYQFMIQYANSFGDGYTSFYGKTNPIGIFEPKVTSDFDLPTSKAIKIAVSDLDTTGLYDYFNLVVVKIINNTPTAELVGTFPLVESTFNYTYTGSQAVDSTVNFEDVFAEADYYDLAQDVFSVGNVLGWANMSKYEDENLQPIWSKVQVEWESWKLPYNKFEGYSDGINLSLYRCYPRDEVVALEGCFLYSNGQRSKGCHIPGRLAVAFDRELLSLSNPDVATVPLSECDTATAKQRWQTYNTGTLKGYSQEYLDYMATHEDECIEVTNSSSNSYSGTINFGSECVRATIDQAAGPGGVDVQFAFISRNLVTPPNPDPGIRYVGYGSDIFPEVYPFVTVSTNNSDVMIIHIPEGETTATYCEDQDGFIWSGYPYSTYGHSIGVWKFFIKIDCATINFNVVLEPDVPQNNNYEVVNLPNECPDEETTETICFPDKCYIGPYQYGDMGFWESTEKYPNNSLIWGTDSNTPIRHHRMPDCLITHIHDNNTTGEKEFQHSVFPLGIKINAASLYAAIDASGLTAEEKSRIVGFQIMRGDIEGNNSIIAKGMFTNVGKYSYEGQTRYFGNYPFNDLRPDPFFANTKLSQRAGYVPEKSLNAFGADSKSRYMFYSPDTSFEKPTGVDSGYIKMETIEYGSSYGHFVPVEKNAEYKFLTPNTQQAAAGVARASGLTVGAGTFGSPTFDIAPIVPTYNEMVDLFEKISPYTNHGYAYHAVGKYSNYYPIPNDGEKIRGLRTGKYVTDGFQSIETGHTLNHFRRESAVYLHTLDDLLYPHEYDSSVPQDKSRYKAPAGNLNTERKTPISAYYGAIKRLIPDQYGRMYSYQTVDTGYYQSLDLNNRITRFPTVFGGDTTIGQFGLKVKVPIFRMNTVGAANGTDIQYDELGNYGDPMFWVSTKPEEFNIDVQDEIDDMAQQVNMTNIGNILGNILTGGGLGSFKAMALIAKVFQEIYEKLGVKNTNLDRYSIKGITEQGIMYLFVYGIPHFFVESKVNVDFRQATNDLEGNFYPNVGGDIPDDWLQEIKVPIINDNKYTFNTTYKRQNKLTYFSHLREDWDPDKTCLKEYPNRAIWSDPSSQEETKNNWLVYRSAAYEDLPKSYGALTSIDGLENNQLLVRFENRSQILNALTVVDTSTPEKFYFGNDQLFSGSRPIDLSVSNSGSAGSQNQFLLTTEFGHIFIDALRGQVIQLRGQSVENLADANVSKWMRHHLPFRISSEIEEVPTDNNFFGIGLTGIYDPFYKRIFITKLDYEPLVSGITYDDGKFYRNNVEVYLTDETLFCNKSWTLSYSFKTQSWISFHTFTPNFYVGFPNYFQTGNSSGVWAHNQNLQKFNHYYGSPAPYIIEYPFAYKGMDELLQCVREYTTALIYDSYDISREPDELIYFNKGVVWNRKDCSGLMLFTPKPKGNLSSYMQFPKLHSDSREILIDKVKGLIQYNSIWNIVSNKTIPIWTEACGYSIDKTLNTAALDYGKRTFAKAPLRAQDSRVRHILDNRNNVKLISKFIMQQTQQSYT